MHLRRVVRSVHTIPAGVFRAGRALSTGPLRLARYRGRRRPGGRPGDRELPDHPGQARRADAFLRPAAAFPRPPEALAGGAAQGKIAAMLRWIACAAALGSAAEIGRASCRERVEVRGGAVRIEEKE